MHRGVPGVRDPGLLVHHRKPPARVAGACETIESRHRTIVDIECKASFGFTAQRQSGCRLDGAAMAYGDHVVACLLNRDANDRATDAGVEVHKTLTARRRLVD